MRVCHANENWSGGRGGEVWKTGKQAGAAAASRLSSLKGDPLSTGCHHHESKGRTTEGWSPTILRGTRVGPTQALWHRGPHCHLRGPVVEGRVMQTHGQACGFAPGWS